MGRLSLNIWLLRDCEPLPLTENVRQMRMGRLAQALLARGHQVTWWASTFNHFQKQQLFKEDQELLLPSGLRLNLLETGTYRRTFSLARLRHHSLLAQKFQQEARKKEIPDIIVTSFPTIELAYEGALYAAEKHIPLIVDVRDMWPDSFKDYFPFWLSPAIRWGIRSLQKKTAYSLRQATALVSMSQHVLKWALEKRGTSCVHTRLFYLGAEPPCIPSSSQLKAKLIYTSGRVVFTFIGSFGYAYDFETLLKAINFCARNVPQAFFVLGGEGEQRETLAKKVKGLDNISILEWQSREEVNNWLAVSDVILVPCRFDAVPNKFCEALAWGKPVLASGPEGAEMQEICENSKVGLFFEKGDTQKLCQHIRTLVEHKKDRENMGEKARHLYIKEFQADRVSERYAEYIEELAQNKKELCDQ